MAYKRYLGNGRYARYLGQGSDEPLVDQETASPYEIEDVSGLELTPPTPVAPPPMMVDTSGLTLTPPTVTPAPTPVSSGPLPSQQAIQVAPGVYATNQASVGQIQQAIATTPGASTGATTFSLPVSAPVVATAAAPTATSQTFSQWLSSTSAGVSNSVWLLGLGALTAVGIVVATKKKKRR